jgi:hypothetical protein
METIRFTVIRLDGVDEVDAMVDDAPEASSAAVLLTAAAVRQCLGWERKPEGLCHGDVCIPARQLAGIERDDGLFELAALASLLGRPLAIDMACRAAFIGVSAPDRSAALARFEAPDFTLPDLQGRLHSLAEHRGKKVFLATWASW